MYWLEDYVKRAHRAPRKASQCHSVLCVSRHAQTSLYSLGRRSPIARCEVLMTRAYMTVALPASVKLALMLRKCWIASRILLQSIFLKLLYQSKNMSSI